MKRSHKVLVLFVAMLGLYGCARGPAAWAPTATLAPARRTKSRLGRNSAPPPPPAFLPPTPPLLRGQTCPDTEALDQANA